MGEAEALARALDDRARLGRVLAEMAQVLRLTGDPDGAMAAGQQALELAAALGDSALQGQASYHLGQTYHAIGDFGRAAELLRRNVEAADRESGTPSTDVRIESRAWLARTLSALGAFAEGRRHGEEALRLATLEGRGQTPIIAHGCLGRPVPRPRGPGARHPGVGAGPGPLSCLRRPGLVASRSRRAWALPMRSRGASRRGARCWRRRSAKVSARARCEVMPAGSHGSARSVVWRDAARRPGSTRARRSTWPGSTRNAGTRRSRCTSLAPSMPTPTPPDAAQAEAHYQQALALAEELGMRPLQAHCHRGLGTLYAQTGQREQARAELSTAIDAVPRHGDDLLAAPGGGGAGAGGGAVRDYGVILTAVLVLLHQETSDQHCGSIA